MLGLIGEFFDMDRAYIFTINHKAQTMTYAYEWCASDVGEEEGSIADVPLSVFPWWMKKLNEEGLVYVEDIAMYRAKASGKNQYIMCTKHMKEDAKKKMILSNHLFRAIDNEELIVYYQPQISFKTGKIIGVEALLRWQHPEHGMVPPDTFIPLAEKNGAINRIGEWVLRTAC